MTDRKDSEISEDRIDTTQEQTEATASPARRKLLRVLAGAGGVVATGALLPEKWTQPLVNRVMVPAHAQATAVSYSGSDPGQLDIGALPSEGLGSRLLNAVIPQANAGEFQNGSYYQSPINVCIVGTGGSRTVQISSCCDQPSEILKVQGNMMIGPVGQYSVNAEFTGDSWVVTVTGKGCPGFVVRNGDIPNAAPTPAASRLARVVDAVIPAANAGIGSGDYVWEVTCVPGQCLGRPTCPDIDPLPL